MYNRRDECPGDLVILTYQPTNSKFELTKKTAKDHNSWIRSQSSAKCQFPWHSPLFHSIPSAIVTMRIVVDITQNVEAKVSQAAMEKCLEESIHLYDGPGVLSSRIKAKSHRGNYVYKSTTFQVFAVSFKFKRCQQASTGGFFCIQCRDMSLHYEGRRKFVKRISVENDKLSYQLPLDTKSYTKDRIMQYAYKFVSQKILVIEMTDLVGSSHTSYSEHFYLNIYLRSQQQLTYYDPFRLCYYGLVAIGYWSTMANGEKKHHMVSLCKTRVTKKTRIYISSEKIIEFTIIT